MVARLVRRILIRAEVAELQRDLLQGSKREFSRRGGSGRREGGSCFVCSAGAGGGVGGPAGLLVPEESHPVVGSVIRVSRPTQRPEAAVALRAGVADFPAVEVVGADELPLP